MSKDRDHHHGDEAPETGAWDDETAQWYAENFGDHATNRMTVERAELHSGDIVLDIGCGTGTAVREAATRVPKGRVIGVDPTPAMCRIAAEQTAEHPERGRIEFLEADAGHLPLSDASVTVALAINSLHHWNDPEHDLGEVRRVLRSGGRLYVADEETEDGKCGHGDGPLSDPNTAAEMIAKAGFTDVSVGIHTEGDVKMFLITARLE